MPIMSIMSQYFKLGSGAIVNLFHFGYAVRLTISSYRIYLEAYAPGPVPLDVTANIILNNYDDDAGSVQQGLAILSGSDFGTSNQVYTITGPAASDTTGFDITLTQGAVTSGYQYNDMPGLVSVPPFPIEILVTPSFVSRPTADVVNIEFDLVAAYPVRETIQFFIQVSNPTNTGGVISTPVTINQGETTVNVSQQYTGVSGSGSYSIGMNGFPNIPAYYSPIFTQASLIIPAF